MRTFGSLWYIQYCLKQTFNTNMYRRIQKMKQNEHKSDVVELLSSPAYIRQPVPSIIGEFGLVMKIVFTSMYSLLR